MTRIKLQDAEKPQIIHKMQTIMSMTKVGIIIIILISFILASNNNRLEFPDNLIRSIFLPSELNKNKNGYSDLIAEAWLATANIVKIQIIEIIKPSVCKACPNPSVIPE
ncbi:hypothetical protein [Paenibacillus larvae]|uniref:hypothetical protein n=1 Tax=Paenibacillus larvae TaxID=1464 RepID=UPI002890B73E|nr:hypothetical protein [Paenibacillus larvae]MDT2193292.1 hypothetical protein [Paenibacillus larvae]MDT2258392.1 hypothetical protein [Paenibacillus larvae]MDT2262475.1 hypothetical protein [Paenibacillus larvae]MDT2273889.1 hypothetical protein [Paenibacillus larvae]